MVLLSFLAKFSIFPCFGRNDPTLQDLVQPVPERLEIHEPVQTLERITRPSTTPHNDRPGGHNAAPPPVLVTLGAAAPYWARCDSPGGASKTGRLEKLLAFRLA